MPRDLPTMLAALQPLEGDFSPAVRLAPRDTNGTALCELTDGDVRRLMADAILDEPGGDAKLAAAYLMGIASWSICEGLVGLAMRGLWLAAARPDAVRLTQRFVHWEEDGDKGVSLAFDLEIDSEHTAFVDIVACAGFATTLEEVHAPLVDALYAASGLSRAALWRLVADSLAAAFLEHGRHLDRVDQAMAYARTILRDRSTKLANRQTDFEWITLPENPDTGRWMRLRGGCCRYYTAPRGNADYCTTCVLRDAESRRKRFQAYIRENSGA